MEKDGNAQDLGTLGCCGDCRIASVGVFVDLLLDEEEGVADVATVGVDNKKTGAGRMQLTKLKKFFSFMVTKT